MLYIVGTPIGNLQDMSPRAVEALKKAEVIIMESPADSKKLLHALEIGEKVVRKFNDENGKKVIELLVKELSEKDGAYITSAGMPTVSDPGALLVSEARKNGIQVQVIPGPSAVTTALAGSGVRTNEFTFVGFPPRKQGQLEKLFGGYAERETVLVFFESPFRIVKTLQALVRVAPEAYVCAAKELTKLFENYFTGTPEEVIKQLSENQKNTKGEFTVVVDFGK
jgi:16S rRNA (cytidine1402-2'-O)-methyltransferase